MEEDIEMEEEERLSPVFSTRAHHRRIVETRGENSFSIIHDASPSRAHMQTQSSETLSAEDLIREGIISVTDNDTMNSDTQGNQYLPPESRNTSPRSTREIEWETDEGWMPKPARLHSGKTRFCAVCFAPLQYTTVQSWDEYLESEEYLMCLQENLLHDTFISGLICGDTTGGDLPTEHRMHKNRKMKCRQSVHDYHNMTSAGVIDYSIKDKSSVRTLEEMLISALPTPVFTHVLERRFAVISHSTKIACNLMKKGRTKKQPRELAPPIPNVELHHLAIHTLSTLLSSFHYQNAKSFQPFEEISRLLTCFPPMSLFSSWSPPPKNPEKIHPLKKENVKASSISTSPRAHPSDWAINGIDGTYWQSTQRPGTVFFTIKEINLLSSVSSIYIKWHLKSFPQTLVVQFKILGETNYTTLSEHLANPTLPEFIPIHFPKEIDCEEIRLMMTGVPSGNRNGYYAIEHLRLYVPSTSALVVDPQNTLHCVTRWLLGALDHSNEDIVIEAFGALKAWALATGSLHAVMLFVDMLVKLGASHSYKAKPGLVRFAVDEGFLFYESIQAYREEVKNRIARQDCKKKGSESRKIHALFEPSICSSGVTIEEGGLTVRTRETSYQYAAVNAGISSGKASWKFRLDNDTPDDEMTCFGAAILPVTVSGYDSSPNLWMLRGYNGNLYARGHKMNRSIGKVHPGDVVQIDVDMSEGTMSYKINENEFGVVFTDLLGHEIYPAVSFYGSGKVITLLSMYKWDDSELGATVIDPVYLSSMKEYHSFVGYGTLGKGGALGYASESDSRSSSSSTNANSIQIGGDSKQRCLSTHPPARGEAYVIYDLSDAYDHFVGSVAINDHVSNEALAQRGVSICFSIWADGKQLWQSKPICEVRQIEQFDISVRNVRMLELKVSCGGSNHCAHAIWVDPCLYPLEEWTCQECKYINKGISKHCVVCMLSNRDDFISADSVNVKSKSMNVSESSENTVIETNQVVSHKSRAELLNMQHPFEELASMVIKEVAEMCHVLAHPKYNYMDPKNTIVEYHLDHRRLARSSHTFARFEEPFCLQPCGDVFRMLLDMLKSFSALAKTVHPERQSAIADKATGLLYIVSANLRSLGEYDISFQELGITHDLIAELREELEMITRTNLKSTGNSDFEKIWFGVRMAAAETIVTGFTVLYSESSQKIELLLTFLREFKQENDQVANIASEKSSLFLLSSLLQLLSAPGKDGIVSLISQVEEESSPMMGSGDSKVLSLNPMVKEIMSLLFSIVFNTKFHTQTSLNPVIHHAKSLLKTYQLCLLAEAIELTATVVGQETGGNDGTNVHMKPDGILLDSDKLPVLDSSRTNKRRTFLQDATLEYGSLLLNACRELIEHKAKKQAERLFWNPDSDVNTSSNQLNSTLSAVSDLLPWFISCLCVLRRQTWLARPILPLIVRLLSSLDQYCADMAMVNKSEMRLRKLELRYKSTAIEINELEKSYFSGPHGSNAASIAASSMDKSTAISFRNSKQMYNVFKQLYTGDKDHFEGQIGFQFEATSTFFIIALGRSVNPTKNNGRLLKQHTIRLWEESTQLLVAQVNVSAASKKDSLGYVYEALPVPARITQGKLYRLTTHEYANGGDPWYKKENLPDEEYDSSYIKILRDCYASGSTGFPNSQNLSGAAYGVPTFLVEGENPLDVLPRYVPSFGAMSLKLNTKRHLKSLCISHSGTTAHIIGDSDYWRSCVVQSAILHGVHAIDFIVKSGRVGGVISGHICVGVDWSSVQNHRSNYKSDSKEAFLGADNSSLGWMPSIGSLWVQCKRFDYGEKVNVIPGDVLTLLVDYDLQTLSFAYNGRKMGVAIGNEAFHPVCSSFSVLPQALHAGVSLYGVQDVVQIRPAGIARSTLQIHWLLDLLNSISSLGGRIASTLISGQPVDGVEEELLPWLQSQLLSGGILASKCGVANTSSTDWRSALLLECTKNPSTSIDPTLMLSSLLGDASLTASKSVGEVVPNNGDSKSRINNNELEKLYFDVSDEGPANALLTWLEKVAPDRSFLSRLGKFPKCERMTLVALIRHAPTHVLHEVQAILSSATSYPNESCDFLDHVNLLAPSEDMLQIWKLVITLRHWLIKTRQEYKARCSDKEESSESESKQEESLLDSCIKNVDNFSDDKVKLLQATLHFEKKLSLPKTFDDLTKQLCERAQFLCLLEPSSEEKRQNRLGIDSQVALSNLAEKWSAQKTPPSLQPMLERWKSLKEADSSRWSGVVNVLRAQHRWRNRKSSATDRNGDEESNPVEDDSEENDEEPHEEDYKKNNFRATMKACDLYIRNGVGAPPEILIALLERRQKRSESRIFGLDGMRTVIRCVSFDSARLNAILFLRPALRGFTDDEKESREQNDGQVVTETFRATVRHHYLKGLEGCHRDAVDSVQQSFWGLYSFLAQLLMNNSSSFSTIARSNASMAALNTTNPLMSSSSSTKFVKMMDPQLKQAILCAWSLDFEARDHSYLLKTGILNILHELFSISSVKSIAEDDLKSLTPVSKKHCTSLNWFPLSEEFVQQGLLHTGMMTKRDILRLVSRAPSYACPSSWWLENEIEFDSSCLSRNTASSMSLLYAELLRNLQKKLDWCQYRWLGRKVVQFGMNSSSTSVKADDISYVETPALGEVVEFTIEIWVHPIELHGYRSIRSDNGFMKGSVYLELVEGYLQVAINGNTPREQLFDAYHFKTHEWSHLAIVYSPTEHQVRLFVNGQQRQVKKYVKIVDQVHLRNARLGCWVNDLEATQSSSGSVSSSNIVAQRCFKGSMAEIRVWKIARSPYQIHRDFERSVPFEVKDSHGSKKLLALWHLNEGEGKCGYDRVDFQFNKPHAPLPDTLKDGKHFNAKISGCHWGKMNVPLLEHPIIMALDEANWRRVLRGIKKFQRRLASIARNFSIASILQSKHAAQYEEQKFCLEKQQLEFEEDNNEDCLNRNSENKNEELIMASWTLSTDERILHMKQLRRCAWIVFRFLAIVGICGIDERRESEAKLAAASAKLKRKQRLLKGGNDGYGSGSSNPSTPTGLRAAKAAASLNYEDDEEQHARTAEAASDAAKSAATNRDLEEPRLQTLWFSIEFHRKVFEVIEKELLLATSLMQEVEKTGLTRAQRMVRSVSTPLQNGTIKNSAKTDMTLASIAERRVSNVHTHTVEVSEASTVALQRSNTLHFRASEKKGSTKRHDGNVSVDALELIEPLEVEIHMFGLLNFIFSQSHHSPALNYLSRPRIVRELLHLLRIASPRAQRIVKLLLRSLCTEGAVQPSHIRNILGSESVLIDLLLDQVAESVCSTAGPISTHALLGVQSNIEDGSTGASAINESLSNPLGFRSGQIYLALASESVALLRLLLKEKNWQKHVSEILINTIRNIAPILKRKRLHRDSPYADDVSDLRVRAAIIRAVGALCVLGSHTDCIRIGGKVEVFTKESESGNSNSTHLSSKINDHNSLSSKNLSDYAHSSSSLPTATATLIELGFHGNGIARVVFDAFSKDSDPAHNVQEVNLLALTPIEEIRLSPHMIPITQEIMPVILHLASLEECEFLMSFDELWRVQIRSRALLALESLLRYSASIAQGILSEVISRNNSSLLATALHPIKLNSFVSLPFLQERGRMILSRLIEASTPLGKAMFHGLGEPTLPDSLPSDGPNKSQTSIASLEEESKDNELDEVEETEEVRLRRGFASTLAAMGFEFDLCMAALEHARNDPNMAVEWLMGSGAVEYEERRQAQRQAEAAAKATAAATANVSTSLGEVTVGDVLSSTLQIKAQELAQISSMPYCLAYCALELFNCDPNRAMEWLMEHGHTYIDRPEWILQLSDVFQSKETHHLDDKAALEDIDQPDPLIASSCRNVDTSKSPFATPNGESLNATAVTVAPILPCVNSKSTSKKSGYGRLDKNYLTPNVLLTVSDEIGAVTRLSASCRTGIFRQLSANGEEVLITFLNTETGAFEDEWHPPRNVRRFTKIYDEPLTDVNSIHKVALRTERALSTHYARRAIIAVLDAWEEKQEEKINLLDAVGGPRQFVNLLKLVVASESAFTKQRDTSSYKKYRKAKDMMNRKNLSSGKSLLKIMQKIMLEILEEESQSGKLQQADWLWLGVKNSGSLMIEIGEKESKSPPCTPAKLLRSSDRLSPSRPSQLSPSSLGIDSAAFDHALSMSDASGFLLGTTEEEDDELNQAIALSIQEALPSEPSILIPSESSTSQEKVPPASIVPVTSSTTTAAHTSPSTVAEESKQEAEDEDREENILQRLHSAQPRAMRQRQPSYTEAQEVATAYLEGGIDDHDGLLSSVLVKECVSHFVESTRVAGTGESSVKKSKSNQMLEFQSLHPHVGRCDYSRHVYFDTDAITCHSLRIVFDIRCAFGSKATLNFYSDSSFENKIITIDASSISASKSIADVVIHSNEFWFRFVSACDDSSSKQPFGYRFQVKPTASIQWSNETEVLQNPSLEWACWVLEFLLIDAQEQLVQRGAVHNRKVYGALVRYLRSHGAPFKSRVVRLLIQLLSRPNLFQGDEVPDLEPIEAIGKLALQLAQEQKEKKKKTFLSCHLLQLIELSMMATRARAYFTEKNNPPPSILSSSACTTGTFSQKWKLPFQLPTSPAEKTPEENLNDTLALCRFLLNETQEIPQDLLVSIWLDMYGASTVLETSHPYNSETNLKGMIEFEGAKSLLLTFDARCSTAENLSLELVTTNTNTTTNTTTTTSVASSSTTTAIVATTNATSTATMGNTSSFNSSNINSTETSELQPIRVLPRRSGSTGGSGSGSSNSSSSNSSSSSAGGGGGGGSIGISEVRSVNLYSGSNGCWPSGTVDFTGDRLEYTFVGDINPDSHYGISMSVTAVGFSKEKQLKRLTIDKLKMLLHLLQQFQQSHEEEKTLTRTKWISSMDAQLVDWVNNYVENGDGTSNNQRTTTTNVVSAMELKPFDVHFHPQIDGLRCSLLLEFKVELVQLRFALLKLFNQSLEQSVTFLDLRDTKSNWTMAYKLRRLSHCIFFELKNTLVEAAIEATTTPPPPTTTSTTTTTSSNDTNSNMITARITLDRLQALESREDHTVEPSISECFFAQAFRQLREIDSSVFRRKIDTKGRLFNVKFRGEEGVDWGGVYREGANSIVDDLFSSHFQLFVLCPNGQHDIGLNRNMYVPNRQCTSPIAMQMYEFVGQLLGISLRTHGDFPFCFPSLVWKQIIQQPLTKEDLENTDALLVQMLNGLRFCEKDGITNEKKFQKAFSQNNNFIFFTTFDSNGKEIELIEKGKQIQVTFKNRLKFCQFVEKYRLKKEFYLQIQAIRKGFEKIFPLHILTLFTWQEMEILTCGNPKISIDLWKQNTKYEGYQEKDITIQLFWEVLTCFTEKQRSDFVRFAWGRSRLPRGKWIQPFKITKKTGETSIFSLPVAHTCFFSIELPPYTSKEKMHNMLLATINFGLGGILMA